LFEAGSAAIHIAGFRPASLRNQDRVEHYTVQEKKTISRPGEDTHRTSVNAIWRAEHGLKRRKHLKEKERRRKDDRKRKNEES
jgi:hypothetical protein